MLFRSLRIPEIQIFQKFLEILNESPLLLLLKAEEYVKPGSERCFYQLFFLELRKFTSKIPSWKY